MYDIEGCVNIQKQYFVNCIKYEVDYTAGWLLKERQSRLYDVQIPQFPGHKEQGRHTRQ